MTNDIDLLRFRFDVAQGDVQKAKASVKDVQGEVDKFNKVLERLERLYVATLKSQLASARANTNAAGSATKAARAAEKQAAATRDVGSAATKSASEVDRLRAAQDKFDATSKQVALAGDFQSNLGAVRGLAGAAGASGIGEGIGVAGEIAVLAEELPRLKAAAAGLPATLASAASAIGPVGLAVGAALAAVTVAFSSAVAEVQKDAELLREIVSAQSKARVDIATGGVTRDEATETFAANQARVAALQTELNRLRQDEANTFAESVEKYKQSALGLEVVGDAAARTLQQIESGGTGASVFADSIKEVETELNSLQAENFELGRALTDTTTQFKEVDNSAEEAAEASKRVAEAAKAEAIAKRELARVAQEQIAIDNKLIELRQLSINAERLTADQIDERIQRNREQIELNSELVRSGAVGIETQQRLQGETQQLIESNRVLADSLPGAQARAAAERLRSVAKELAAIGQQTGAENTRFQGALDAIAGNLREKLADLAGDRDNAIGKAQSEAFSARAEAVRQNGRQLAELESKTAKERQRIIRSANASIANAIQDRDAVALLAANAARREQLQTLDESYKDQRERINDALSETNSAIATKLQEQTDAARAQYSQQTQAALQAAQQQRQAEVQKNQQILAELRQAAQQALQIERNKNQSLVSSAIAAATRISSVFSGIAQRVAASAAASSRVGSAGSMSSGIKPLVRPPSSAGFRSGNLAGALTRSSSGGSGVNVNIANAGVTPKIVGDTVAAAYSNFLRGFTS